MTSPIFFALVGILLFCIGLYAVVLREHLLRKILALNVMGSGVFLCLVALARRTPEAGADPVPHAMVITGIVVAVSATALALALLIKMHATCGEVRLPGPDHRQP